MTEVAIRPGASRHGATTGRKDDPKRERRTRGTQSNRAPVHASDVPERIRPSQSEPRREYKSRYVILERAATLQPFHARTHARTHSYARTYESSRVLAGLADRDASFLPASSFFALLPVLSLFRLVRSLDVFRSSHYSFSPLFPSPSPFSIPSPRPNATAPCSVWKYSATPRRIV